MNTAPTQTAVITGASRGLGAEYARLLAQRGFNLLLVARDADRLNRLAREISAAHGNRVEIFVADVTREPDLQALEERLAADDSIEILVNNAGAALFSSGASIEADAVQRLVALNIISLTRLTTATLQGMQERGHGKIINIASVLGLHYLPNSAVYSGTKAFVIAYSRSLQAEFAAKGIQIQAVLPGALKTDLWQDAGLPHTNLPQEWLMTAEEAARAALAGFDLKEDVTVLSLPDLEDWTRFEQARQALIPNLSRTTPADRYLQPETA